MAATLLSAGTSVSVVDQSFYLPVSSTTVPLFFIATEANKLQPDGVSPAAGTLEHDVVRTVTSRLQSRELYGNPVFRKNISGTPFHGDARNEYGLMALEGFLDIGNRAYVVRANIDLDDSTKQYLAIGTPIAGPVTFTGIGDGTIGPIQISPTTSSFSVQPQTITVTFTSATSFSVTGSIAGSIVNGNVGTPISGAAPVSFTITAGSSPFATGDKFRFDVVNTAVAGLTNVGNGTITGLVTDTNAVANTNPVTITFTSPTAYSVTYPVGPGGSGTVGFAYDDNRLNFLITAGTTPFAIGDTFDLVISTVTVTNPLGATDAQRRVAIVSALEASINSNIDVRSEQYEYNLILCPGYFETAASMTALSVAVKEEAMVIGDTPCYMTPEQVAQWAVVGPGREFKNTIAYYYPWGIQSTLEGDDVLVAPSGIALATIAYSDNQSYVWEAPAGLNRGLTFNTTAVGYVSGDLGGPTTFTSVALNQGQRDMLYVPQVNLNPIVFFPGRGIIVWGQKTSSPVSSALDRINVVRLVMYIRRVLRKGAMPFVFEPNDQITRDSLKAAADGMLNDVLSKRGLMDFATYSDETNNTAYVIDNNQLYLDVAIKPMKSAEFIYIPIRVVSSGTKI